MEKQILLDQLDDRVKRALALIIAIYPRVLDGEDMEEEELKGILDIIDGLKVMVSTVIDVQYNDNIDHYKDSIYEIAAMRDYGEEDE